MDKQRDRIFQCGSEPIVIEVRCEPDNLIPRPFRPKSGPGVYAVTVSEPVRRMSRDEEPT